MDEERARHLIKTMEKVDRRNREQGHNHLNMGIWSTAKKRECGTVACAGGHEALTRYANDKGLRMKEDCGDFVPYYKTTESTGFTAMADYLDITDEESNFIFDPAAYIHNYGDTEKITPRHIMKRLKWMLKADRTEEIADGDEDNNWHMLPGGLEE